MKVRTHCNYLKDKVGTTIIQIGRLAKTQWGLRQRTLTTIYKRIFAPTVTYAAKGWADLCIEANLKILKALQRRVLIRTTGTHRTALWESLCVVSGDPIDLLLKEEQCTK